MKILIAAGIYPPDAGGPAVHAKAQFEGFPRFGAKTGLVALAHYRHWPAGIRHILYFLKLLSKVYRYDVIYGHDAVGAGIPALIAARIFHKKFVVRIGGDLAWERRAETANLSMREWYASGEYHKDKMFRLSRWLMKHADLIAVPSPLLVDLYTSYYGINDSKLKLIPNPFPVRGKQVDKKEHSIIWASRLTAYKNLPVALRALAKIFPDHPDLKFIIMGDGPEQEGLKALSQTLGIQNDVVFTGSVPLETVLEKTASCLFVIAPALTEFNPNYVLQGISFGKPFIISREHGLPFPVPEAMLFNPRDEEELEHKILSMLDPSNYDRAVETVKKIDITATWDDNLKANLEVIKSLS